MNLKSPRFLRVNQYEIPVFNDEKKKVTVGCVGDFHISKITSEKQKAFLKRGFETVRPDVILVHGDLVDSPEYLEDEKIVRELEKELKICAGFAPTLITLGNHDQITSSGRRDLPKIPEGIVEKFEKIFERVNVKLLKDEWFEFKDLRVFGFLQGPECSRKNGKAAENYSEMERKIKKLFKDRKLETKPGKANWFFSHAPLQDLVYLKELRGFEVFSFGHMHGGCVPIGVDKVVDKIGWNGGIVSPHKGLLPKKQTRGIEILPNRARVVVNTGMVAISDVGPKALQYVNALKAAEVTGVIIC
ncbi:metallophosphoesterase [Candidatus Saccharibacteria bacterium]|nr:metallophosphoesterase [Candidatus Saccharibacteria bacterium]